MVRKFPAIVTQAGSALLEMPGTLQVTMQAASRDECSRTARSSAWDVRAADSWQVRPAGRTQPYRGRVVAMARLLGIESATRRRLIRSTSQRCPRCRCHSVCESL